MMAVKNINCVALCMVNASAHCCWCLVLMHNEIFKSISTMYDHC